MKLHLIRHYFNHIEYTNWPFYISLWVSLLIYFFIQYINKYISISPVILLFVFLGLFFQIENWNKDIIIETTYFGRYSKKIYSILTFSFFLFLMSEVMLFSGFFWSFFDRIFFISSFVDGIVVITPLGQPWIHLDWSRLPLIGTLLLIASGYYCNTSLYSFKVGIFDESYTFLIFGIIIGLAFIYIQEYEYYEFVLTIFDISNSSLFFLLTGFHGMHVLVGLLMLSTQCDRLWSREFSAQRCAGFSYSLIYWHFVDIIWIFLFIFVYWFNNRKTISILSINNNIHLTLENSYFFVFV